MERAEKTGPLGVQGSRSKKGTLMAVELGRTDILVLIRHKAADLFAAVDDEVTGESVVGNDFINDTLDELSELTSELYEIAHGAGEDANRAEQKALEDAGL